MISLLVLVAEKDRAHGKPPSVGFMYFAHKRLADVVRSRISYSNSGIYLAYMCNEVNYKCLRPLYPAVGNKL